jgi:dTDP-4-dehydrorhamnose reductase
MSKTRVIVLGASGMLGAMVVDYLSQNEKLEVVGTVRTIEVRDQLASRLSAVDWRTFDVIDRETTTAQLAALGRSEWIVNAIGLIKPYIKDDNSLEIQRALLVNSQFPHWLGEVATSWKSTVLQIATDCVYAGTKGNYIETDKHDAIDVYGKTKSLGEAFDEATKILRCSIVGPELKGHVSLLDWFRKQKSGAKLNGFTNHNWNGVTTLHFAKICEGIITHRPNLARMQHVIPSGQISKFELVSSFARSFNRPDVEITPTVAATEINRTLGTTNADKNLELWDAAGYRGTPPTVPQMVEELAKFQGRLSS